MSQTATSLPVSAASTSDTTLGLLTNIGTSLAIVLLAIFVCVWIMKRCGLKKSNNTLIKVKSNCYLTPKERIVLIEVNDKVLVVGATSQQMTLLHTFNADEFHDTSASNTPKESPFAKLLATTLKRKSSS